MLNSKKILRCVITLTIIFVCLTNNLFAGAGRAPEVGQKVRIKTINGSNYYIQGVIGGIDGDVLSIIKRGDFCIDRVVIRDGITYNFPYAAKYDPKSNILTGTKSDGESVKIPLEAIEEVEMTFFTKGKEFHLKFDAEGFHDRVEFGPAYQRLVWRGSANSLERMDVWQKKNKFPFMAISGLMGMGIGLIIGENTYRSQEIRRRKNDEKFLGHLMQIYLPKHTHMIIGGTIGLIGGALIGKLVAPKDGWRNVPVDNWKLDVGMVGEGMGMSLSYNF